MGLHRDVFPLLERISNLTIQKSFFCQEAAGAGLLTMSRQARSRGQSQTSGAQWHVWSELFARGYTSQVVNGLILSLKSFQTNGPQDHVSVEKDGERDLPFQESPAGSLEVPTCVQCWRSIRSSVSAGFASATQQESGATNCYLSFHECWTGNSNFIMLAVSGALFIARK